MAKIRITSVKTVEGGYQVTADVFKSGRKMTDSSFLRSDSWFCREEYGKPQEGSVIENNP